MKRNGAPPLAAPRFFSPRRYAGWSLIELVVVLVVISVLVFFAVRSYQPKDALALQQAERLRNDLRHVQMLAITWSESLRVTTVAEIPGANCPPAVAGRYEVRCVSGSATPPCNGANPVVDPATGRPYSISLECGFNISGPGFSLDLDTLGRPKNGANLIGANATFTITGGSVARTVVVVPVTGFVTAQ